MKSSVLLPIFAILPILAIAQDTDTCTAIFSRISMSTADGRRPATGTEKCLYFATISLNVFIDIVDATCDNRSKALLMECALFKTNRHHHHHHELKTCQRGQMENCERTPSLYVDKMCSIVALVTRHPDMCRPDLSAYRMLRDYANFANTNCAELCSIPYQTFLAGLSSSPPGLTRKRRQLDTFPFPGSLNHCRSLIANGMDVAVELVGEWYCPGFTDRLDSLCNENGRSALIDFTTHEQPQVLYRVQCLTCLLSSAFKKAQQSFALNLFSISSVVVTQAGKPYTSIGADRFCSKFLSDLITTTTTTTTTTSTPYVQDCGSYSCRPPLNFIPRPIWDFDRDSRSRERSVEVLEIFNFAPPRPPPPPPPAPMPLGLPRFVDVSRERTVERTRSGEWDRSREQLSLRMPLDRSRERDRPRDRSRERDRSRQLLLDRSIERSRTWDRSRDRDRSEVREWFRFQNIGSQRIPHFPRLDSHEGSVEFGRGRNDHRASLHHHPHCRIPATPTNGFFEYVSSLCDERSATCQYLGSIRLTCSPGYGPVPPSRGRQIYCISDEKDPEFLKWDIELPQCLPIS